MSLVKTLAKVAIGMAVAKGVSGMMKKGSGGQASRGGQDGLGGILGGLAGSMGQGRSGGAGTGRTYGGPNSAPKGGLEDILGGLLGGSNTNAGRQTGGMPGGLGGLLEQLGGGGGSSRSGGGLQDILGGLAGKAGAGGALGELADALNKRPQQNDRSFGDVLNSSFDQTPEREIEPSADQEAAAALMLRAMIQATKADGELDDEERKGLIERLGGDVSQEEARFVEAELRAPMDVDGLVRQVPRGMGPQVYAMSVLGIDLDNQKEAQYLHALAQGLGLDQRSVNNIHEQLGVPSLYA